MHECEPSAPKSIIVKQPPIISASAPLHDGSGRGRHGSVSLQEKNFSFVGAFLIVVSLAAYLIDTLTDILVSIKYLHGGDVYWGVLTLAFVFIPSIIIQVFSLRWYSADGNVKGWRTWLLHICQFQPLERYLYALAAGIDARRTQDEADIEVYLYQQNDVCMLRLFEAFLESAPQLTLQLYIMVATQVAGWLTALSASMSLLAIGWAVAAYSHALRCAYRNNYSVSCTGLGLQTIWHICMVAARVSAFVAFASVYHEWIFLVFGVHWLLMTAWIILQKTDFCPTRIEEVLFNFVVGFVYCFCFFSLKEGPTRWRLGIFYSIFFIENTVLVCLWLPHLHHLRYQDYILLSAVFFGFFFGLCCLLLYYRFCHPSSPIYCCHAKSSMITNPDEKSAPDGALTDQHFRQILPYKLSTLKQQQGNPARSSAAALPQRSVPPSLSAAVLPRRTLLKTTSTTHTSVLYKPVETPSRLTPITSDSGEVRSLPYNGTYGWDAGSVFQHYSINASLCFYASKCGTIDTSGVELSRASVSPEGNPRVSRELRFNDADGVLDASNDDKVERVFAKASRHGSRYGYIGYNDDESAEQQNESSSKLPPPDIVADSLVNTPCDCQETPVNSQRDLVTSAFSDVSPFANVPMTPYFMSTPACYLKAGPRPLVMVTPIKADFSENEVLSNSVDGLDRSQYDNLIPTQSQDGGSYFHSTPHKEQNVVCINKEDNSQIVGNDAAVSDIVQGEMPTYIYTEHEEIPETTPFTRQNLSSHVTPLLDAHSLAVSPHVNSQSTKHSPPPSSSRRSSQNKQPPV